MELPQADQQCENCRFWFQVDENRGYCRRYPPVAIGDKWANPPCDYEDWCGEWQGVTPVPPGGG